MPRLVLIGECMVELAPAAGGALYAMGFAGDTFNTAWYARRGLPADWQVDYVTAVGADPLSDRMLTFMQAAGIGTGHVQRRDDRTVGLYMISLQNGERTFSYWRGESAARRLADDAARLAAALARADAIFVSGITLAVLENGGRGRLLEALASARRAGATLIFDSNLRPRLWPDAGTMRLAVTDMAAACDIALPGHEDEAAAFGDADPVATAARYRAAGARLVVVKNGADEIVAEDPEGRVAFHPAPAPRVVDTTAAGDSFNAGFLAGHLCGADLEVAVRRGADLAARVVQARGALVEVPV